MTQNPAAVEMMSFINRPLEVADPELAALIEKERQRQKKGIELIASEVREEEAKLASGKEVFSFLIACSTKTFFSYFSLLLVKT